MNSQPGNHGKRQICQPECEVTTPYPWRPMTVVNAVWCHSPLTMATMYNTHQGLTHASGVTQTLYYIIVVIITTTTIVIIVKKTSPVLLYLL